MKEIFDHIRNALNLTEIQEKVLGVVTYLHDDAGYSKEDAATDLLEVVVSLHKLSGDFILPMQEMQKSPAESREEQ